MTEAVLQARSKIKALDELVRELDAIRDGRKIIHCHGVFDLLHIGHIRHLQQAKRLGDVLVVTVTPDRFVNKGPHRPAFTDALRAEALAALEIVDLVAINEWPNAVETIRLLRPHVYAKGPDYRDRVRDETGSIKLEEQSVRSVGGVFRVTDDITFSSSALLNKYMPAFPQDVQQYLERFRKKFRPEDVLASLEGARRLRAVVVGETIIDEYQYCSAIGKSGKEPVLATRLESMERFAGGVLAVANHMASFVDEVTILTFLGEQAKEEEFVRHHLKPNVRLMAVSKPNSPTIVKRRFVESYLLQKLFEVYEMNDDELPAGANSEFCGRLAEVLPQSDLAVVVDYGHGLMTREAIETLARDSPFLAVNTQANAGNWGLNTISKYPKADYVCLAGHEMKLETRKKYRNIEDQVHAVAGQLGARDVMVTQGVNGNVFYRRGAGLFAAPALAHKVVDRVGSGDAVLALTSILAAQEAPPEIVGLVGNMAGAEAVATLGHRSSIEKPPFMKFLKTLLK